MSKPLSRRSRDFSVGIPPIDSGRGIPEVRRERENRLAREGEGGENEAERPGLGPWRNPGGRMAETASGHRRRRLALWVYLENGTVSGTFSG
jgi:hypothetical protein